MKSGFICIAGIPNAGKSTLINSLVGEKVAIVSPKPQTTRDRILGILNEEGAQIVFADTPGIYKSGNALTAVMMRTAETSAKDVDLILFVHDGHKGVTDADISLMRRYLALGEPMLIAYTKTDIMPAENIPADAQKLFEAGISCTVVPVSARRGKNISKLKDAIAELLPEGEPLFPEDVLSDKSEKFMVGEIMRILDGPFGIVDVTIENIQCGFDNSAIGHTVNAIRECTPDDILRLSDKYLRAGDLVEVTVG